MKKTIVLMLLLLYTSFFYAQMPGFSSSYFSGFVGVQDNPSFAHNGVSGELNVFSMSTSIFNDMAYYKNINNFSFFKYINYPSANLSNMYFVGDYKSEFLKLNQDKPAMNMDGNYNMILPSLMIRVGKNKRATIGFSIISKNQTNVEGISYNLANIFHTTNYDTTFISKSFKENGFTIMSNSWMEYSFTYAHKIMFNPNNSISFGTNLKFLIGTGTGYMNVSDLNYIVGKNNTIYHMEGNMTYIYDEGFNKFTSGDPLQMSGSYGWGVDFGISYEFDNDLDDVIPTFRFGAAIVDFGRINYQNKIVKKEYDLLRIFIPFSTFDVNNASELESSFDEYFSEVDIDDPYIFNLPTKINLFIDGEIGKTNIHLSAQVYSSIKYQTINNQDVYAGNLFIFTPKYELNRFGVYLPFSYYDKFDTYSAGFSMNLLNMVAFGSSDIISNIVKTVFSSEIHGTNFYFSLKIPIIKKS